MNLNLTVTEIYGKLCPGCKEKMQQLVKEKMADDLVRRALEGEPKEKEGGKP